VPRSAAMKMVGHKTEAMYRRYAIADESMLREGAVKLEALLAAQRGALRVVVPLRTDKVSTKSGGVETVREGLSAAEIAERIGSEMVGRDGIEPPTPGFSNLNLNRRHRSSSQLIRSKSHGHSREGACSGSSHAGKCLCSSGHLQGLGCTRSSLEA
jgi:hypothetical protein